MKLDYFNLEEYNEKNIDHRTVIIELYNDKDGKEYLGDLNYAIDRINERKQESKLNFAYIAYRKDEPIGYISLTTKDSRQEISYGIRPKYRGENLGMLLLSDFTEHLFIEYEELNELDLIISKSNHHSQNTADLAGYNKVSENKYICKRR